MNENLKISYFLNRKSDLRSKKKENHQNFAGNPFLRVKMNNCHYVNLKLFSVRVYEWVYKGMRYMRFNEVHEVVEGRCVFGWRLVISGYMRLFEVCEVI